ncbi:beta-N-acetylhexosaminidase [Desulfitispora alkaliphila]|uniref:beta-N-acetylhexosaminidase n=1 Tax=Desulfitispora alkaliphila TaxID=622674 RepID=UPI003D21EC67
MKRFSILLLLLMFIFLFTACDTGVEPQDSKVDKIISHMTIEEKVGQMLMPDIRMWQGENTTGMNPGTEQMIKGYHLGGVILFEKNIETSHQLAKFTHQLQNTSSIPMFISIDQEGGRVQRLPQGTNMPGNMALGATGSPDTTYQAAKVMAQELKALGINLNFAPVLDVNNNPANPVINTRSFGADPDLVSKLGISYMEGLHSEGIIATAKHFPGHGDTDTDSHLELPSLPHSRERLDQVELKPFREIIEVGIDMIMTAHVTFPEIDNTKLVSKKNGDEITIPATLSHKVLTQLLRDELHFDGVIVTDAFTMKAISDHFGEEEAVVMAIQAGADIILMPNDLEVTFNSILNAVAEGTISEERIDESVKRILDLKDQYNLLEPLEESEAKAVEAATSIVGSSYNKKVEIDIAKQAVTLIRDETNRLPVNINDTKDIAILMPENEHLEFIKKALTLITDSNNLVPEYKSYANKSLDLQSLNLIEDNDLIILGTSNITDTSEELALLRKLLQKANHADTDVIVIALDNPYDLMHLPEVNTYLAIYGSHEPNLTAAVKAIFGEFSPSGTLPVSIPTVAD